jgi:hypothetical protein
MKQLIISEDRLSSVKLKILSLFLKLLGIHAHFEPRCTLSFSADDIWLYIQDQREDGYFSPWVTFSDQDIEDILTTCQKGLDCSVGLSWENIYQETDCKYIELKAVYIP